MSSNRQTITIQNIYSKNTRFVALKSEFSEIKLSSWVESFRVQLLLSLRVPIAWKNSPFFNSWRTWIDLGTFEP